MGSQVVSQLLARGAQVRALVRLSRVLGRPLRSYRGGHLEGGMNTLVRAA